MDETTRAGYPAVVAAGGAGVDRTRAIPGLRCRRIVRWTGAALACALTLCGGLASPWLPPAVHAQQRATGEPPRGRVIVDSESTSRARSVDLPPGISEGTVGTMPGAVSVGASGGVGWSTALEVVPGVGGMEPSLSISYSGTGYGGLGVGFSLSGESSISRCAQTLGQDGRDAPITWTLSDALCLDGVRLVPVKGEQGKHGTEYRLQTSPNVRVIALSKDSTSEYSGFGVYTGDGRVSLYGVQIAQGWTSEGMQYAHRDGQRVPLSWHLTRVRDQRTGNEMQYRYGGDPVSEEGEITPRDFRLTAIEYGINEKAGAAASRRVAFEYRPVQDVLGPTFSWEDSSWVHEGYIAGQHYVRRQVVSEVLMGLGKDADNWTPMRKYKIGYEGVPQLKTKLDPEPEVEPLALPDEPPPTQSTSDRVRVRALQQCGRMNSELWSCYWPTLFEYATQMSGMEQMHDFGWSGVEFYRQPPASQLETIYYPRVAAHLTGDFDADGDVDMLVMPEWANDHLLPADHDRSQDQWEFWETDENVNGPKKTGVRTWSFTPWTSRAGTVVPSVGAIGFGPNASVPRPPDPVRTGNHRDSKATPMAFTINFDGTSGTDVLVGEPVIELAGAGLDPPWGTGSRTSSARRFATEANNDAQYGCWSNPTTGDILSEAKFNVCWDDLLQSKGDYTGHPGFMRNLKVLRHAPREGNPAHFSETSLHYNSGQPVLWMLPLDLNGDALSDLMFCKADADYAAVAGQPLPMFYGGDPAYPAVNWVSGTVHYVINEPGKGLDLSNGGVPAMSNGSSGDPMPCHAKDTYFALDLYGDGRESLMHRLHPHAKKKTIAGISPTVPAGPMEDPYPYDPSDTVLTGYMEKLQEKVSAEKWLGHTYYEAFSYTVGEGMHHGPTTLPLEQFMLWQQPGHERIRYSTHQRSSPDDEDGGMTQFHSRDGRATDWSSPDAPMIGGGKPSGMQVGDVNGDGLDDVFMVDITDCYYEQKGLTKNDPPTFPSRTCSYQDAITFGDSLMELTFEKLAVFVYLNRGDGSFTLGSINHLWDTDLNDTQKLVLSTGSAPGLNGSQIKHTWDAAWTIATRATRTWRAEFASSIIGDANADGLADFGYIQLAFKPGLGMQDDTMIGMYRLRPVWRLGRHGGHLAGNRTAMGVPLSDLKIYAAQGRPSWMPQLPYDAISWDAQDYDSPSVATPYEQHNYGLAARLMQIDVDRDGKPEMAFYDHVYNTYTLVRQIGMDEPQPHLLTAVTDGLGARTEIDYAPQWTLTDPSTPWTKDDTQLPYPLWQRPSATAVAMQLRTDTGKDDGDKPLYNKTHYLYGKSRSDVRLGIGLGIERSTAEQSVLLPGGAVNRRVTTRYDVDATYDPNFKAYPLAGTALSTTTLSWGTADPTAALTHSMQRYSAHTGNHPGTWWRGVDASAASAYEIGEELSPAKMATFAACLIEGNDDCAAGPEDSYVPLGSSTTTTIYDEHNYGLVKSQIVESAGSTTVTETAFEHRDPATLPNPYLIGLPTGVTVANEPSPAAGFTVRTTEMAYDSLGRLEATTIEPDQPQYRSTVSSTFDAFGNIESQTLSADGIDPATTTYGYGASGVYQTSVTNALGHTATTDWYESCGVPERNTNPLGHTVVSDIDVHCRSRGTQTFFGDIPLNRHTTIALAEWEPNADEAYPDREVHVTTQVEDGAKSHTIANRLGQTLVAQSQAFGFETYVQTRYDVLGRISEVSPPTKVGEQPQGWITTAYDAQGRTIGVVKPDGSLQTTRYSRYLTESTNELGYTGSSTVNALGQVERVTPPTDPAHPDQDTSFRYTYGAFGTLVRAEPWTPTDLKSPTTLQYDDYGRLTRSEDGQAGVRLTRYDALGRVEETEDALGQITRNEYDVLGRLTRRTAAKGTPEAKTAMWDYDKIAPGVLTQAINEDATVIEEPLLDEMFRPAGMRTTIHGRVFEQRQAFDAWGRPSSATLPSLSAFAPVTTWTNYNGFDQPIEQGYNGQLLWEPVAADVWGLTEQRYGTGVLTAHTSHDPLTGRLQEARTNRHVTMNGADQTYPIEHFTYGWYDNGFLRTRTRKFDESLHPEENDQSDVFRYTPRGELHSWSTIGKNNAVQHQSMAYDGFGNVTGSKVGQHSYFNADLQAHDEKLQSIDGSWGKIGYTYNDNGQVLTRTHSGGETKLVYDALGHIEAITAPGIDQHITYSADGAKMHVRDQATGRETFHVGSYQEERGGELASKGVAIGRYALGAAYLTRTWMLADHSYSDDLAYTPPADTLGSTTLVTDATGAVTDRRAYDPWGNERDPTDLTQFKAAPKDDVLTPAAGYTGHHERKQFGATAPGIGGLVDMHTRYYDPAALRFMEPDSIVPDVFDPGSWNRFTYVGNNPVNFVDPLGMAAIDSVMDALEGINGDTYSNSQNMIQSNGAFANAGPAQATAPVGRASGEILATMRAGRDRMAGKVAGAQAAKFDKPLNEKLLSEMTQSERSLYLRYLRDKGNYAKNADKAAPFDTLEEYEAWYETSAEAEAMRVSGEMMEGMANDAERTADFLGFSEIGPRVSQSMRRGFRTMSGSGGGRRPLPPGMFDADFTGGTGVPGAQNAMSFRAANLSMESVNATGRGRMLRVTANSVSVGFARQQASRLGIVLDANQATPANVTEIMRFSALDHMTITRISVTVYTRNADQARALVNQIGQMHPDGRMMVETGRGLTRPYDISIRQTVDHSSVLPTYGVRVEGHLDSSRQP